MNNKIDKIIILKNFFLILIQVFFIVLIWLVSDFLSNKIITFLPASVLGIILILILLFCRIPINFFSYGAYWLISEIILFFIPAIVSILKYQELLFSQGIVILIVIFISTLMVIIFTALVVKYLYVRQIKNIKKNKSNVKINN